MFSKILQILRLQPWIWKKKSRSLEHFFLTLRKSEQFEGTPIFAPYFQGVRSPFNPAPLLFSLSFIIDPQGQISLKMKIRACPVWKIISPIVLYVLINYILKMGQWNFWNNILKQDKIINLYLPKAESIRQRRKKILTISLIILNVNVLAEILRLCEFLPGDLLLYADWRVFSNMMR